MSFNIQKLKELRKNLRYSQAELAKEAGIPAATVSAIEAGRSKQPRYATVVSIAKVLGISPDELFFGHSA